MPAPIAAVLEVACDCEAVGVELGAAVAVAADEEAGSGFKEFELDVIADEEDDEADGLLAEDDDVAADDLDTALMTVTVE